MISFNAFFGGIVFLSSCAHNVHCNDGSCDDTSSVDKLIDWVQSNGGFFGPKHEFRRAIPGDLSSHFGVFATEDIEEDELLMSVPWKCILNDPKDAIKSFHNFADENMYFNCGSTQLLLDEMRKGDQSFYEPYTSYILDQPRGRIPSDWTKAGKDLLEEIIGFDMLPPKDVVELVVLWKRFCEVEASDDPLVERALIEYHSRGDDDMLVPLFELYNHGNGMQANSYSEVTFGVKQEMFASRAIKKGDEITYSYSLNDDEDLDGIDTYDTSQFLRDYGIVETLPQKWIIPEHGLSFKVVSTYEIIWNQEPEFEGIKFLEEQYERLNEIIGPRLKEIEKKARSGNIADTENYIPLPNELNTIRRYFNAIKSAISLALQSAVEEWGEHAIEFSVSYDDIQTPEQGDRHHNSHENFPSYNFERPDPNWITIDLDPPGYQEIKWVGDPKKNDVCFVLDSWSYQSCSSFRAHYHDIAAHFPTRYFESVRRVAILGGGDGLMLHEMMKYDTIEKVVQLELDQRVLRKSHKYFASQPFFHDERVEWWFGNAAKSLLMLPNDYFGSFDIVFVDLSESGFLSSSVTDDLSVWEIIVQLLSPEGILIKNEPYHETLKSFFDQTMLIYYEHVPIIESWALAIGSNRMDLLQPNATSMKKWGSVKTVLEHYSASPDDFNDHFKFVHDYQVNDARTDGKCKKTRSVTEAHENPLAGILFILEAENTSQAFEIDDVFVALGEVGVTPTFSLKHSLEDDKILGTVFLREGFVTVRSWPLVNYCAFDVQLWGAFNQLENIKKRLAKMAGSSTDSLSSYRIVTSGMSGVVKLDEDRKGIGPTNVNSRECNEIELADVEIDEDILESVIEKSLGMIQEKSGTVAVLCGSSDEPCRSHDVLLKKGSNFNTEPLWSCPDIVDMEEDDERYTLLMFECELKLLDHLHDTVSQNGQIAGFILDSSAPMTMAILAHRIWKNPRNKRSLLANRFSFIAFMESESEYWMEDFLEWRRKEMIDYEHLFRAEVAVGSTNGVIELGILSGQDVNFFGRLVNVTSLMEEHTGLTTKIKKVEGGIEEIPTDQESKWYVEDDFERSEGESQFAGQRPLAEQNVFQFTATRTELSMDLLEEAMRVSLLEHTDVKFHSWHDLVDGFILASVSSLGTTALVWDGLESVVINIFCYESEAIESFRIRFFAFLRNKIEVELESRDVFPRGIGRVVNLKKDLKVWKNLSNANSGLDSQTSSS
uniref:PABS domain-containing protein n=1 Tax=Corethron hystrix TaxID=216773 RepID=A0A7S1G0Z9_9STRA